MRTTDKLPFPPNLPPLPEPPAGHEWQYRGMGWNPGDERTYITSHVIKDDLQWIERTQIPRGDAYPQDHYAEAVPVSTEPDYQDRAYQKSIWIAAFEGSDCGFCMDGVWFDKADHSEIADAIMRGNKVRLTPTKKRIPLTAEDIPAVCWLRIPNVDGDILVTAIYHDCVHAGHGRVQKYDEMLGWEYSPDRRNWKPCYVEVEG